MTRQFLLLRAQGACEWRVFLHTRALGFNCVRLVGMKAAPDDAILLMQSMLQNSLGALSSKQ